MSEKYNEGRFVEVGGLELTSDAQHYGQLILDRLDELESRLDDIEGENLDG